MKNSLKGLFLSAALASGCNTEKSYVKDTAQQVTQEFDERDEDAADTINAMREQESSRILNGMTRFCDDLMPPTFRTLQSALKEAKKNKGEFVCSKMSDAHEFVKITQAACSDVIDVFDQMDERADEIKLPNDRIDVEDIRRNVEEMTEISANLSRMCDKYDTKTSTSSAPREVFE